MGPVSFERAGRRLQIRPNGWGDSAGQGWTVLSQTDTYSVRSLLREFVFGDQDCRHLRDLIGSHGSVAASRLNNAQVIDTVAELVAARRLVILEKVRNTDGATRLRPATVQYTAGESASTPAQLWRQTPAQATSTAQANPAPAEEGFVANVDHDAQAAALKAAAANGVPFCEVCEKARSSAGT